MQQRVADALGGACLPKCVDDLTLDEELIALLHHRNSVPKAAPPARLEPVSGNPLDGLSILIVEDNRVNSRLWTLQVEALGAAVTGVETGEQSLAHCTARRPDCILLDRRLAQESGVDLAHQITQTSLDHPPAMLILSAANQDISDAELHANGLRGWLTKPVEDGVLARTILAVVRDVPVMASPNPPAAAMQGNAPGIASALSSLRPEVLQMLKEDLPNQHDAVIKAWRSIVLMTAWRIR